MRLKKKNIGDVFFFTHFAALTVALIPKGNKEKQCPCPRLDALNQFIIMTMQTAARDAREPSIPGRDSEMPEVINSGRGC